MKTPIEEELRRGTRAQGSELLAEDVGTLISWFGGFGRVLEIDVGKRVWRKSYGIVMENNEQRDQRKCSQGA